MVSLPSTAALGAGPRFRIAPAGLVAALLIGGIMLFKQKVLTDGDTYWHIAAGRWMLEHRRVLTHDIFSYTAPGVDWTSHEWLSELFMAGAYQAAGFAGLLILFALAIGLGAALLAQRLRAQLGMVSVGIALFLVFLLLAPSLLVRPHILALPILVIWLGELLDAREQNRRPGLWLALLMALWANMHGSFVFGFLLAGAFGLEALFAKGADHKAVLRDWGLVAVLCVLGAMATPHGIDGLIYPFKIMTMKTLPQINEWKPPSLSEFGPLKIALFATLAVCLTKGVKVPGIRLALLLFVLHMTTQHVRHQPVMGVVGAMVLAAPIAAALGAARTSPRTPSVVMGAFVAGIAVMIGVRFAIPAKPEPIHSPSAALAKLPAVLADRPVFHTYAFGGWLILEGHKVFIDGRADMYGDAFMKRYVAVRDGDLAAMDREFCRYGIDWTLLRPNEPTVKILDKRPGWRRLYSDKIAVLHVREAALAPGYKGQSQAAPRTPDESPCVAATTGVVKTSENTKGATAAGKAS